MRRILVGSPIRQEPRVLQEFLRSLLELDKTGLTVDFFFVDDNDQPESSALLQAFAPGGRVYRMQGSQGGSAYLKTEQTHLWKEELIWKVASYKDTMIEFAKSEGYDGLFFVDSDLVLHPSTLRHLTGLGVDLVSEVFWTKWTPDQPELPQVWLADHYTLYHRDRGEQITQGEALRRQEAWVQMLRRPGLYEVGGLGALTLFSARAMAAGLSFREIHNVSFWGEDRHFCIRAAALGLRLWVDTHYPALHLYRPEDLSKVPAFRHSFDQVRAEQEALAACKVTLERWGTSHWALPAGEEAGFVPALAQALAAQAAGMQGGTAAVADRLGISQAPAAPGAVSRAHLLWGVPTQEAPGRVRVEGILRQSGREGDQTYQDDNQVVALLERHGSRWLIADMGFEPAESTNLTVPFSRKTRGNKVTLSMVVRNEADRFLRQVLTHAAQYVDEAVILDDGSSDGTAELCAELLQGIPHQIIRLPDSLFKQEHLLRRLQWELTVATRPDWILNLDADELFEDRMALAIRSLIDQDEADLIGFRLYDMWDEEHYRADDLWTAHQRSWPFLVRWDPNMADDWRVMDHHCGRWPLAVDGLRAKGAPLRVKHLGWSRPADRQAKYERYMANDPEGRWGSLAQYESILDPAPTLIPWEENPRG
ncbi:MAG TPA: glycosyltransferase [Symbiobacteriaceae bacterium]|nr:glycosyltransferase [Symbiobacteriaceae bacterium]